MTVVFWLSFGALWIVVIFLALVVLGLARTVHVAAESGTLVEADTNGLQGLPAPAFSTLDLSGADVGSEFFAGRPAALLFVSPDCEHCGVTLQELEALEGKVDGTVIVLCRSSRERCQQLAQTYALRVPVVVDDDFKLSRLFRISGAPTAVLIGANGIIESYGRPMGPSDLEEAVAAAGWMSDGASGDAVDETGGVSEAQIVLQVTKGG